MHFIAFLMTLLLSAFHAQGLSIPSKTLRGDDNAPGIPDVTVKLVAANGTMIDSKPGVKSVQATFVPTAASQSLCDRIPETGAMTSGWALSDDCTALANNYKAIQHGYWDTWGYDSNIALEMVSYQTCAIWISGAGTFHGNVWIGNEDVADAISYVVSQYTHDGLVAAAGQFNCNTDGVRTIDWSVQSSTG
ncbi:hypothetical protein PG984_013531 [Apiospora sp. TS-2023a]